MRAYVTGGNGFVGRWLTRHLEAAGDEVVSLGDEVDVTDPPAIAAALREARPDAVYHLAGLAEPGGSWSDPARWWHVNATGTLHLLQAAVKMPEGDRPRVLVVASAEVYGIVGPEDVPIDERVLMRPVTPYAASKVAADLLAQQAHLGYGLHTIRVRAFNHIGPGQGPGFLVGAVARQVAEAERSGHQAIHVGELSARRDFTDVRDVVRAYRLLIEHGAPGEAYNVCTGEDIEVRHVVERLLALSTAPLHLELDPARVRRVELPVLRGDPAKLRAATSWIPEIDLDRTLADTLDWWREELGAPAP